MELFPKKNVVGIFRGFLEGGLEFHADLVLPYQNDFQRVPMHGRFILVQLETVDEAILGRITSYFSDGKLVSGAGEEFNLRSVQDDREIPEDLKEQYLKYRVNIRVLGILVHSNGKIHFAASQRRMPHVGSKVAFPTDEVLREIAGHHVEGSCLGHLAYGEFIYAGNGGLRRREPWMRVMEPEILVHFPIESLISRRSFIFARAGFGKSNLNKLLFSNLYKNPETATVAKRNGMRVPVGTVIFDPDGEYFWPDDKGRPGFCDVPELREQVVVFTDRMGPSPYYQSFVADKVKLDLRRHRPGEVLSLGLDLERQEQQNVRKLKALTPEKWTELVNLIYRDKLDADNRKIAKLLGLDPVRQEAELLAAKSNMFNLVRLFHAPNCKLFDKLKYALQHGKLCIVDLSQMRGGQSMILSSILLREIFNHNQNEFTKADPKSIPTIAVIEEAQSVLNSNIPASEAYVSWVKEGRKYDLGALMITQQPGSIPTEILSQGDNWFVFHLLSATDLLTLKKANAHFSDDILAGLLNEPIPGQGVFWSSVLKDKQYPIHLRVLSFEDLYKPIDPRYDKARVDTFVDEMRGKFDSYATPDETGADEDRSEVAESPDDLQHTRDVLLQEFKNNLDSDPELRKLRQGGEVLWYKVVRFLEAKIEAHRLYNPSEDFARNYVAELMNSVFGMQGRSWNHERKLVDGKEKRVIKLLGKE